MEEVKVKRALILNPQRMGLVETLRQDWVVNAEAGTTINDVIDPAYWAHVAAKFQPYDHIEVRLETGQWLLELIALDVGRNYARCFITAKHEFGEPDTEATKPLAITHKVEWKGPHRKHVVIRMSDSAALQEGFSEKSAAIEWMNNHLKAIDTV